MKIKLYHICLLYVLAFSGCVAYNITVNKKIYINGSNNQPTIQGATLDDNTLESSPDVKPDVDVDLDIPLK